MIRKSGHRFSAKIVLKQEEQEFGMIGALARKLFGTPNDRRVKGYYPRVADINALEGELEKLSDEALKARTEEFRKELADGKTLDDILVPAFATVREAAKRTLGQRHFDVQLIALSIILIAMTLWRRSPSFSRSVVIANAALMCAGFILTGYQLAGYFVETLA